jgi:hypothetical protein
MNHNILIINHSILEEENMNSIIMESGPCVLRARAVFEKPPLCVFWAMSVLFKNNYFYCYFYRNLDSQQDSV